MDNSLKGAFFALEMNTSKFFQFTRGCAIFIVLFLVFAKEAGAQRDTSMLLRPEQLNENDILTFFKIKDKEVIQSVSRVKEKPGDLPFSTWVITSEDILRYGFVTLADVLKAAPGIRVSQPGNATEGETFMIRGLSGNQYVKILINDIPIKPSVTLGMPIGAQLPIRQAERIEVLYGTSGGMMYGNEACAGVVNIIIKETDRPIYTQADLGFGTQGYNSLDLMFGGRLFKDKNVMRFSLYGSSTVRNKTDIFWDKVAFDPRAYYLRGMNDVDFANFENFKESVTGDNQAIKRPQEHISRMFGMMLTWRGAQFSYHRMGRSDPSCLGYSPLAISYATTGKQIKDRIDVYSLKFWKKRANYQLISNSSLELYEIENTSSANYIFNSVNALSYLSQGGDSLSELDKGLILNRDKNALTSGTRYIYARSADWRWDAIARFRLWRHLWMDNGMNTQTGIGYPQVGQFERPQFQKLFSYKEDNESPFNRNAGREVSIIFHAYSNLEWIGKKVRITAGLGAATSQKISPRFAALYRLDSVSCFFANASQTYKQFQIYQQRNTFEYFVLFGDTTIAPYFPYSDGIDIFNTIETFRSAELGYRRKKSEILFFAQQSYGLSRDGYFRQGPRSRYIGGYYSNPGLSHQIWGIQTRLVTENIVEINKKGRVERNITWRNELFVQYSRGKEWYGLNINPTEEIRNFPKFITQFRSSGRTGRLQYTIAANRQSSVLPKSAPFYSLWSTQFSRAEKHPGFSTWDLLFRFYLNKNFVLYFNTVNIFNRKTYGIDASGSIDDLLAPLQQRRQMRFGINYNMN
jgi:hypothetical protein